MACLFRITFLTRKMSPIAFLSMTRNHRTNTYITYFQYRSFFGSLIHNSENKKSIYSTNIILQDGISAIEMPCIVQVINGDFDLTASNDSLYERMALEGNQATKILNKKVFKNHLRIVLKFMRCKTLSEVINLFENCSMEMVTPPVALAIIQRIFHFENSGTNFYTKNITRLTVIRTLKYLSEIVCFTTDPQLVIDCLQLMSQDPHKNKKYQYLQQICAKGLILAGNGKFSIDQICELIKALYNLGELGEDYADKAWVGIDENKQINVDDICKIMRILSFVNYSRVYLYNIVEKKVPLLWHQLKTEHILEILYSLVALNLPSHRLLAQISRWLLQNVNKLTEGNIRWIIASFLSLEYTDENIQQSINCLLLAKEGGIKDNFLVSQIMEYCCKMRIRHPAVLSYAADYFVEHGKTLSTAEIATIINYFGYLNFLPSESHHFFDTLESQVEEKFLQFDPSDLINVFLSCTYLERYLLSFIKRLSLPQFLGKMHSSNTNTISDNREKLSILKTVLTIEEINVDECILPKSFSSKAIERDSRVMRCMNQIKPTLIEIVGREDKIHHSVIIPSLPYVSLFVIDFIVERSSLMKLKLSNFKFWKEKYALIILLPEHFDITEKFLIGPQMMKMRILEKLGLKVVHLNYRKLTKLYMYPHNLKTYIEEEMMKVKS